MPGTVRRVRLGASGQLTMLQVDTLGCFEADPDDDYCLPVRNRRCAKLMCRRGLLEAHGEGACVFYRLTALGRAALERLGGGEVA